MDKIEIEGGIRLKGEVSISGAKNAALPLMAASILCPGDHYIRNLPQLRDISTMGKLMAHIGMDWSHAVRVIADFPNISTDFSGNMFERGTIEKAVKYLGADRILFGTDAPTAPLGGNLGMLMEAEISHNDRVKIAFDNANELLKLNLNRVSAAPILLSSKSI